MVASSARSHAARTSTAGTGARHDVTGPDDPTQSMADLDEQLVAVQFADFPDETHMLSHAFADGALRFTATALTAGPYSASHAVV